MRFGFFDQVPCASGFTEHQRYKDILAQIELGDDLGFLAGTDPRDAAEAHAADVLGAIGEHHQPVVAGLPGVLGTDQHPGTIDGLHLVAGQTATVQIEKSTDRR